jgi:hypothetical protein
MDENIFGAAYESGREHAFEKLAILDQIGDFYSYSGAKHRYTQRLAKKVEDHPEWAEEMGEKLHKKFSGGERYKGIRGASNQAEDVEKHLNNRRALSAGAEVGAKALGTAGAVGGAGYGIHRLASGDKKKK